MTDAPLDDFDAPLTPDAPAPQPMPAAQVLPPQPPSVHVRAALTWLAIFPLVAIGMIAIAPFSETWHPALRALLLTAIVVPTAVYLVMPRLLRAHATFMVRRRR